MDRSELISYLDDYLQINEIKDYGPQGLQVESEGEDIDKIALMVDVSIAGIQASVEWGAQMMLVHHGVLWRDVERISGALGARVRALLANQIHLYAAHLPLDMHPEVGNNAVLAKMFGVGDVSWWGDAMGKPIGAVGNLAQPRPLPQLVTEINQKLHTESRVLAHGNNRIQRVAIVSGFGATMIAEAVGQGADLFLTGETSHANYWAAEDYAINVVFAGHYATETVGVQALGVHLGEKFGVETRFFDFPTKM